MTNKEIKKYIDRLNNGKSSESIFTRQIGKNVDIAKVWANQPKINDKVYHSAQSFVFFFIKNENNKYIGAVLDMTQDLHWYIVPNSRKNGYLTSALKECILPFLLSEDRDSQRITIQKNEIGEMNYLNSKGVALNLGFEPMNDEQTEFELKKSNFNWEWEKLDEVNSYIEPERYEVLSKRLFYAYRLLHKISDELSANLNDDKGLKEVTDEVKGYIWKIDDLKFENERFE